MVKKYSIIAIFSLIAAGALCNPMSASAFGHEAATNAGESFDVGTTNPLTFQPSPQVIMAGDSDDSAFVVAAVHTGAFAKDNGEAYLMSSDASGLFFTKAADDADLPTIPGELPAKVDENGKIGDYALQPGTTTGG